MTTTSDDPPTYAEARRLRAIELAIQWAGDDVVMSDDLLDVARKIAAYLAPPAGIKLAVDVRGIDAALKASIRRIVRNDGGDVGRAFGA